MIVNSVGVIRRLLPACGQAEVVLGQTCRQLHTWFSIKFNALDSLAPHPIWLKQARWLSQNRYADKMILRRVIEKWRKAAEHRNVNVAPLTFYNVNAFEHSGDASQLATNASDSPLEPEVTWNSDWHWHDRSWQDWHWHGRSWEDWHWHGSSWSEDDHIAYLNAWDAARRERIQQQLWQRHREERTVQPQQTSRAELALTLRDPRSALTYVYRYRF